MLIVATSARALAQSARKGGVEVVALDRFGDVDTLSATGVAEAVPSRGDAFDADRLLDRAQSLCPGPDVGLVYGSGLEHNPALLTRLARGRTLYGNTPETLAWLKQPLEFAELLAGAEIPHPATRIGRPSCADGWLVKRIGGAGGDHVRPLRPNEHPDERHYYQSWLAGRALSLLFLADGHRHRTVGLSEQWCDRSDPSQPFRYGGAVSDAIASPSLRGRLEAATARLVAGSGVRGLNSLDLLVRGDEYWVLEINPRPSATFELYDEKSPDSLFALHVAACRGALPRSVPMAAHVAAHAIVYAPMSGEVPESWVWPAWCKDLPRQGGRIEAGTPLVSVHATAASPVVARILVQQRRRSVVRRWLRLAQRAGAARSSRARSIRNTPPCSEAIR